MEELLCSDMGGVGGTDQDLLSGVVLALDLLSQIAVGDLQILSHFAVILEEGKVTVLDSNQLQEQVKISRLCLYNVHLNMLGVHD